MPTPAAAGTKASIEVAQQQFPGFADQTGVWHFVYCPKEPGKWDYTIRSTDPNLNGQTGSFTATLPEPNQPVSARYANWWTDDPDPALAEGIYQGAKTVSRWREDYLRDFADRMNRCQSPDGKSVAAVATVSTSMREDRLALTPFRQSLPLLNRHKLPRRRPNIFRRRPNQLIVGPLLKHVNAHATHPSLDYTVTRWRGNIANIPTRSITKRRRLGDGDGYDAVGREVAGQGFETDDGRIDSAVGYKFSAIGVKPKDGDAAARRIGSGAADGEQLERRARIVTLDSERERCIGMEQVQQRRVRVTIEGRQVDLEVERSVLVECRDGEIKLIFCQCGRRRRAQESTGSAGNSFTLKGTWSPTGKAPSGTTISIVAAPWIIVTAVWPAAVLASTSV